VALLLASLIAGCGSSSSSPSAPSGPPLGEQLLPDLMPEPPTVLNMRRDAAGAWTMRFTSVLVNVGKGQFRLDGQLVDGTWVVDQLIDHAIGGVETVRTSAEMVWGGDGHNHWHVDRVASYRLQPMKADGSPDVDAASRVDSKVGFCFFDSNRVLESGPPKAHYKRAGCGKQNSTTFEMGLSIGWADTYIFSLPGQSIDVTDLKDGRYRLWAEADERSWFHETSRDNNRTWADISLETTTDGVRLARVTGVGPRPT
jgi:hypothetical protein